MSPSDLDSAFQAIASRLDPAAQLQSHRPLLGGVSAHIHALRYTTPDSELLEVVVRRHGSAEWKPLESNVTAHEFALQRALHSAGIAVPEPLLLDTSGELLPTPFLVMAWVDGTAELKAAEIPGAMEQMADFLAQLHSIDISTPGFEQLPEREDPVAGALQYLPDRYTTPALRAHIKAWPYAPPSRTLLHGDYWPGNVLWRAGQLAAVIDWEDAAIGDPLSDLAASRAELLVVHGEAAMSIFTDRYLARSGLDTSHLTLWEIYVSSAALATMADWGLSAAEEQARRTQTALFLKRAVATLPI